MDMESLHLEITEHIFVTALAQEMASRPEQVLQAKGLRESSTKQAPNKHRKSGNGRRPRATSLMGIIPNLRAKKRYGRCEGTAVPGAGVIHGHIPRSTALCRTRV